MILRSLRIDGFGTHRDFKLDELSAGLNVVHGENEAGKSTILAFVRAILFGFDRREAMVRTLPLSGGRHGGSLVLEHDDGRRVRITRVFQEGGKLAGTLTAEDERSGDPIDPEAALKRALGSCTRLLFENVFAIGLDDLARNGTLSAEGLRDHIYGAGMTGRGVSLPAVLADLRKRGHDILPKTGRGGRVTKLLDEIGTHASAARGFSERPEEHGRCVTEAARLRDRLAMLGAEIPRMRALHTKAERLARAAEPWALLAALPSAGERPVFPAGGRERLKSAQEALEKAKGRRTAAVDRRDDLARRIKRAAFDAKLVDAAPEIDAFFSEAERRIGNDAPASAQAKAEGAAEKARALLADLGSGWDEARLAAFDAAPASERELLLLVDRDAAAVRDAREAGRDAESAAEAEARVRAEVAEFQRAFEQARAEGGAPGVARQGRLLYAVAAVLGAVALIALALGSIGAFSVALAGAVALVLAAVLRPPLPAAGDAAGRERSVLAFERVLRTKSDAHAQASRIASAKRRTAGEADAAREKTKAAIAGWLRARGLPADMPAESARGMLLAVRECQGAFREQVGARDQALQLQSAMTEFAGRVEALGARVGRPGIGRGTLSQLHVALTALVEESRRARRLKEERERDKDDLDKAEAEAKAAAAELESAQQALEALLAEAGARDVDAFWIRAKAAEAWEESEKSRGAHEGKLRAALGEDAEAGEVREALRRKTGAELAREAADHARALEALEAERDKSLRDLATTEKRVEELEKDGALAEARLREESRRAELGVAADQWRVLAACEWLIDRARRKFEEEHQPSILRSAGALLDTFTRGRWVGVRALAGADDGDVLRAVRWDGEAVAPDALSRATVDQLYLALRLALATDFPDPGVRIPMVLDDVLVNFSRSRRAAAAEAMARVARRLQVLAFTCHPELRDALVQADPTARRVELAEPALPPVRKPQLASAE